MATERFYTESGTSPPSSEHLTRLDHIDLHDQDDFLSYEELWEAIQEAYGFTSEGLKLLEGEYDPHDWDDFLLGCLKNDVSALKYAEIYNAKAQEVQS